MSLRLRVPPLCDIVLVDDPQEMDWLERDPAIIREVSPAGGWIHRWLHGRIHPTLSVGTVPLPVFGARDDAERADRQRKLEFRLSTGSMVPPLDGDALSAMARYVAGADAEVPVGVAAQQAVGHMLVPGYAATPESYEAAKLLRDWLKPYPLRALWWRWSGRLARSRQLLWTLAASDPQAIHATTFAVHSIVDALERMRALLKDPRRRDVLAPDQAAAMSLVAPGMLLRSCRRQTEVPFLSDPLVPGTLIIFRLRKMHAGTNDADLAFARGRWNQCPAHGIVPGLLSEVWTRAREEWAQLRYTRYLPTRPARLAVHIFAALNRVVPWHRLPRPLGVANLATFRVVLRERNLHHAPPAAGISRCPLAAWTPRFRNARTADGSYNDLGDPVMGRSGTSFARNEPLNRARVEPEPALLQPNPRLVSRRLLTRETFIPARTLNVLAAAWIQFQGHDWFNHRTTSQERPFELELDAADDWPERPMRISRTERHGPPPRPDAPPVFANTETHWWDASQLYGSTVESQQRVRAWENGKLRLGPNRRLPIAAGHGGEVTGFTENWWIGLSLLHTLFALEHNAICDRLRAEHSGWDDEQLFATARLINAALIAKIHTLEWTPALLAHPAVKIGMRGNWWGLVGERLHRLFGHLSEWDVAWGIPGSATDHHSAPYAMTEEFVAIYRMHPLMPDDFDFFSLQSGRLLETRDLAGVLGPGTRSLLDQIPMADLFYSLGIAHPGALTLHNYPQGLQDFKVPGPGPFQRLDLAAIDVLRDRERGVPRYNAFRRMLHLPPVRTFEELSPRWAGELREVYQHVDRVDLMVGLFAETPPRGFAFSETAFRLFILMASRRLKSDRFFTTDFTPDVYTQTGLDWIADTDMKRVLLRHYPALTPAIQRISNVFGPWDRVTGST